MSTDEDPLAARFEALRERLLGTAWFVVGNREDAREAVQEAFLRCWKARDPSREVRDLDAWIFSVLLNVARDTRRRADTHAKTGKCYRQIDRGGRKNCGG